MSDTNNLKRGKIYLTHGFRDFSSSWSAPLNFWAMGRQNIMAVGAVEKEAVHILLDRKQSGTVTGRDQDRLYPPRT
jgi:hypothetical protein